MFTSFDPCFHSHKGEGGPTDRSVSQQGRQVFVAVPAHFNIPRRDKMESMIILAGRRNRQHKKVKRKQFHRANT